MARGPIRVLHVLDHSHPVESGYAVRTRAILAHQRSAGIRARALTGPKQGVTTRDREVVGGTEHLRTPALGPLVRSLPFLREWRAMRATAGRLAAAVREERPDVIHAHSPVLNALPAIRVARRFGIPVVYEVRAFWEDAAVGRGKWPEDGFRYRLTRHLETRALRRVDGVVAICAGVRREIVSRGIPESRIRIVPNGADPVVERPEDHVARRAGPTLGYFGSYYSYEGLDLLVRSLPEVRRRYPAARLILAGGGPAEARIRADASECGVASMVRFLGRLDPKALAGWYREVDALVFPRRRSRLTELVTPLKPLEAMARGRAVLASDVGGHREIVTDGVTGALFPSDDPAAIARSILGVCADEGRRSSLAERGRETIARERDWATIVPRYVDLYARVARRGPVRRPAVVSAVALP